MCVYSYQNLNVLMCCSGLTWLMVYRTEKYQKLKAEVEKQSKKREFVEISSPKARRAKWAFTCFLSFSGKKERGTWGLFGQAAEEEDRTGGGKAEEQQSRPVPRENEVNVRDRVRVHGAVEYVQQHIRWTSGRQITVRPDQLDTRLIAQKSPGRQLHGVLVYIFVHTVYHEYQTGKWGLTLVPIAWASARLSIRLIFRTSRKCLALHHPELRVSRAAVSSDLHLSNLNKFKFNELLYWCLQRSLLYILLGVKVYVQLIFAIFTRAILYILNYI